MATIVTSTKLITFGATFFFGWQMNKWHTKAKLAPVLDGIDLTLVRLTHSNPGLDLLRVTQSQADTVRKFAGFKLGCDQYGNEWWY